MYFLKVHGCSRQFSVALSVAVELWSNSGSSARIPGKARRLTTPAEAPVPLDSFLAQPRSYVAGLPTNLIPRLNGDVDADYEAGFCQHACGSMARSKSK